MCMNGVEDKHLASSFTAEEKPIGLLYMAYGSPRSLEEVEAYYSLIRRGHRPSEEELAVLKARYETIGGSPLMALCEEQGKDLAGVLREAGLKVKLYFGYRFVEPSIATTMERMAKEGITQVIALACTPFSTPATLGPYKNSLAHEAKRYGIEYVLVPGWYEEPLWIDYWVKAIKELELKLETDTGREGTSKTRKRHYLFSAHSLPLSILTEGDAYVTQVEALTKAVAYESGLSQESFSLVWQSAGPRGQWLGPDISEAIKALALQEVKELMVIPVGFVTDHLEVLYDNDVECAALCKDLAMGYCRPPMPNVAPSAIEAMKEAVMNTIKLDQGGIL